MNKRPESPRRSETVDEELARFYRDSLHRAHLHQPESDIVSVLDRYRADHRRHVRRLAWRRFWRDLRAMVARALPEAFKLAVAVMLAWWATVVVWALVSPNA